MCANFSLGFAVTFIPLGAQFLLANAPFRIRRARKPGLTRKLDPRFQSVSELIQFAQPAQTCHIALRF
jgi:hypothetical protein